MSRVKDITGMTFDKLTVVKKLNETYGNSIVWLCKCECGNEHKSTSTRLKASKIASCLPCKNKRRSEMNKQRVTRVGDISSSWWKSRVEKRAKGYNKGHKNQGKFDYDIDMEYGWKLFLEQGKKCAYTNQPLFFPKGNNKYNTNASLDRIDASKGYVKGNVQWVDKDVNKIKNKFSHDYFIQTCMEIAGANCEVEL